MAGSVEFHALLEPARRRQRRVLATYYPRKITVQEYGDNRCDNEKGKGIRPDLRTHKTNIFRVVTTRPILSDAPLDTGIGSTCATDRIRTTVIPGGIQLQELRLQRVTSLVPFSWLLRSLAYNVPALLCHSTTCSCPVSYAIMLSVYVAKNSRYLHDSHFLKTQIARFIGFQG